MVDAQSGKTAKPWKDAAKSIAIRALGTFVGRVGADEFSEANLIDRWMQAVKEFLRQMGG